MTLLLDCSPSWSGQRDPNPGTVRCYNGTDVDNASYVVPLGMRRAATSMCPLRPADKYDRSYRAILAHHDGQSARYLIDI